MPARLIGPQRKSGRRLASAVEWRSAQLTSNDSCPAAILARHKIRARGLFTSSQSHAQTDLRCAADVNEALSEFLRTAEKAVSKPKRLKRKRC